jgi:hypothetical protein
MLPMVGVRLRIDRVEQHAVGIGQHALAVFLFHHRALGLEVLLVHVEVGQPFGLGPQQGLQMVARHDLEIVGDVITGGGIVGAAHVLGQPVELLGVHVLGALEHQVFKQMRETRAPLRVVLGADVVPHLHGHIRASRSAGCAGDTGSEG